MLSLKVSKSDPPVGAIILSKVVQQAVASKIEWGAETSLDIGDKIVLTTNAGIVRYDVISHLIIPTTCSPITRARSSSSLRYFARSAPQKNLYGKCALVRTEVDHWLTFSLGALSSRSTELKASLEHLDSVVKPDAFLVGGQVSAADYAIFGALFANGQWQVSYSLLCDRVNV